MRTIATDTGAVLDAPDLPNNYVYVAPDYGAGSHSAPISTDSAIRSQRSANDLSSFVSGESRSRLMAYEHADATTPPDWERQLASFAMLKQGWDGYHAPPPTQLAIARAAQLLEAFDRDSLEPDRFAPSVVGGIGLTIRNADGRKVYIEVYNDATVYMMLSDGFAEPTVFPAQLETERDTSALTQQARQHLGR